VRDRPRGPCPAVHDGCVHLHASRGGENGAAPGVEELTGFEKYDGPLHGVEGRPASQEHLASDRQAFHQGATNLRLLIAPALQGTSAAVDG
jgi:hypothetical protein